MAQGEQDGFGLPFTACILLLLADGGPLIFRPLLLAV
jgi:hypothetical protein